MLEREEQKERGDDEKRRGGEEPALYMARKAEDRETAELLKDIRVGGVERSRLGV